MTELKSSDPLALRILMNEEIYRVEEGTATINQPGMAPENIETESARPQPPVQVQVSEPVPASVDMPKAKKDIPVGQVPAVAIPNIAATLSKEEEESTIFDYLGENNRYMVIVHHSNGSKFMPSKEVESLTSILHAKKMEMKDVAVVNIASYPSATAAGLRQYFACSSIVLLGVSPQQLKLPEIPLNSISQWQGINVLFTYDFPGMLDSNDKKRAFWNEMKKL